MAGIASMVDLIFFVCSLSSLYCPAVCSHRDLILYTITVGKITAVQALCYIYRRQNYKHNSNFIPSWPAPARPTVDARPTTVGPGHPQSAWVHSWPRTDTPTYNYRNGTGTSILDLTFATPTSTESITSCAVDDEATTGSDHEVIRFEFSTSTIEDTTTHPICQQLNYKKADWTQFHNTRQNLTPNALLQMQQQLLPISEIGRAHV